MLAQEDKRSDERFVSNAPIIFSHFSTRFWQEYPSTTRNFSRNGMCFETFQPLTPGTNLFIRVDQHPRSESGTQLRTSTLAEVKWCREVPDTHGVGYCVGVRYY
jgi:hypothetical protein